MNTVIESGIWMTAAGILVFFLRRRRSRRTRALNLIEPGVEAEVRARLPLTASTNRKQGERMDLAMQGAIWLGAGVTLVVLLTRRRRRQVIR